MTLAAGSRLGPYEIVASLGAGGMGEVYRARDSRLGRDVAVKVLPPHLSSSAESRQRFEREARTISQLSHPHICALYDVGREGDTEYLVMELLEGETLADRLARGPLPLDHALRCGIEIADALDKAHRRGIVHRDLKPGNVMLSKSGVKLLDFGLAKVMEPVSRQSSLTELPTQHALTQEGTVLGTFQYMAPEQLEGKESDARTDVFALGCVLYEMVTGRRAFAATSQASLIGAILHKEPESMSQVEPMTPRALDRAVRRCLAKDPEDRWQSARDVALELAEASRPEEAAAPAPARRRSPSEFVAWAIAGALVLALIGILAGPWRPRSTPPAATKLRFTIPPPPGSALQGMLALSPAGESLAFVATGADGRDRLWVRGLDSLDARQLEGTDGAQFPFWSPDGRSIAFFADGKLKRVDSLGETPRTLCNAVMARGGSWGANGKIVFSDKAGGSMVLVSENGGQPRPLPVPSAGEELLRWPSFLPDGRHFLYCVLGGPDGRGVHVGSVDSKESTRVVPDADAGAMYSPPGYLLYRSGDRLMSRPFDADKMRTAGDATPIVEDVWWDGISTLATAFSVSANGVLAYQTGGLAVSRLLLYDRAGKEIGPIGPPAAYFEPLFSPDARSLVVSRGIKEQAMLTDTWIADIARGTMTRLSMERQNTATALWSPDGSQIAFTVFPDGEVFVRDSHGAGKPKILFRPPSFSPLEDWSRDGRYIFFTTIDFKSMRFSSGVHDLNEKTSRELIPGSSANASNTVLSPDGRWMAYVSDESGAWEIYVRSFPAGSDRQQVSVNGGSQPRWRGDGRELFYVAPDRKIMSVDVRQEERLEAGAPRPLFQTRIVPLVEARNHFDVTRDGQRFVVNSRRPEDAAQPITVVVGWAPEAKK